MQRYFVEESLAIGQSMPLPENVYHHWVKVLRAEIGSDAEFVDANEHLYVGTLTKLNEDGAVMTVQSQLAVNVELPVRVTIASGLPKGEKAEWITQKATELGADDIVFFAAAWSIAKWNDNKVEKKVARLQKIADGAAEQAHRTHRPRVRYVKRLTEILNEPADLRIIAYEESAKQGETTKLAQALAQLTAGDRVTAVFGPEGGLTPEEVQEATQNGAVSVGLGPRILRTETAPLYFLAAVSTVIELQA
ncbi:16S rRNA (uracil(1498)-N(3))-methyltransferase [Levilactobacillus bambusae]|uniref:Ribosomal RNA small subunit methyltransferase E n=1 Tax=Levilactobacillus bambusae TaxID=2024736 RepID=A0A2V1N0Z5_9LACO|nr:16S rRNA (uracil(1498)-N(3))-methyltransferase [Levilactobacillus bambusae]PWG00752.1 16S rRNA (uracil(1498)-N(3))-methyltransferase [Levilactobacillus bambusae]